MVFGWSFADTVAAMSSRPLEISIGPPPQMRESQLRVQLLTENDQLEVRMHICPPSLHA